MSPQEIFERYIYLGAITRNAAAVAEMFTIDGVLESPFVSAGDPLPRRMEGREKIRKGLAAFHERPATVPGALNIEKSRYVLHTTGDPDVFIAEIDTAFDGPDGTTTMSLVQIFRLRDGQISHLRDYFTLADL